MTKLLEQVINRLHWHNSCFSSYECPATHTKRTARTAVTFESIMEPIAVSAAVHGYRSGYLLLITTFITITHTEVSEVMMTALHYRFTHTQSTDAHLPYTLHIPISVMRCIPGKWSRRGLCATVSRFVLLQALHFLVLWAVWGVERGGGIWENVQLCAFCEKTVRDAKMPNKLTMILFHFISTRGVVRCKIQSSAQPLFTLGGVILYFLTDLNVYKAINVLPNER